MGALLRERIGSKPLYISLDIDVLDPAYPREPEHRSLWSYAPENLIYFGSFSKVFSPGVRVGWMGAPKDVRGVVFVPGSAFFSNPHDGAGTLRLAFS